MTDIYRIYPVIYDIQKYIISKQHTSKLGDWSMFTKLKHLLQSLTGENPVRESKEESIDPGALGPEQTILLLLSENGGHLRQQEIVAAVDWSPATVSRRLSEMEEQGRIRRLKEHREKHVWLPGQPPEWVKANYMSKSPGIRQPKW